MYIIIDEEGTPRKTEKVPEGWREAVDSGIISVINITKPEEPRDYYNGKWAVLEDY